MLIVMLSGVQVFLICRVLSVLSACLPVETLSVWTLGLLDNDIGTVCLSVS